MITIKLAIAIIAFILSSGQIVFQTFQHHHAVNPKHGFIKFLVFILSSVSLIYLAKDIYADFEPEKTAITQTSTATSQAELDYWHRVDRNASAESYCDYLEKYPHGQFIDVAKHRIPGDCWQVKREAEAELKKKAEAEALALKEKLDADTKALKEKNARLEQEAKDNAARISALEQAKTEAELKSQSEATAETQLEAELKAKFESDKPLPEIQLPAEAVKPAFESEIKPQTESDEPLF